MPKLAVGLRLTAETKEGLELAAKEERRPLSQLVEIILSDWLADRKSPAKKRARN